MKMKTQAIQTTIATALLSAVVLAPALPAYAENTKSVQSIEDRLSNVRLVIKREDGLGGTFYETKTVPLDQMEEAEAEILRQPDVIKVERDIPVFTPKPQPEQDAVTSGSAFSNAASYNDPLYDQLDYFTPNEQYNSRIQEAHDRLNFANNVRIGIIDGGFVKTSEINYVAGYTFDYGRGPAFYNSDPTVGCTGPNADTHGDQVGQVAAGIGNNAYATVGAAPGADVIAGRVHDCDGFGSLFAVSEAVNWMAGDGPNDVPALGEQVDVINMSLGALGNGCPTYLQDAIDAARAKGIVVVASTGNSDNSAQNEVPASCPGVIAVASTTNQGFKSGFSNTGPTTDIAAQGSAIPVTKQDGSTTLIYGTSFATPIVAGTIASTLADRPNLTPAEIDNILAAAGKPSRSSSADLGAGIMDSMLLLDGAGVIREIIAAQLAVEGEREQYAEALTHPRAEAYLQTQTRGADACSLVEVDGRFVANAPESDELVVFSVQQGDPLDPTRAFEVFAQTDSTRAIVDKGRIDSALSSNLEVGIAHCDVTTGSNCSVVDTIRGYDADAIQTPSSCS